MRKLLSIFGLAFCLVVVTAVAASAKGYSHTAKGDVTTIDSTAMTFGVKGEHQGAKEQTFTVTSTTKLESAGKPITLADLRSGEGVTVWYVTKDGKKEASRVVVEPVTPTGH
ncbi:MAG TPA: hypothetical protein VGV61_10445 [Thermoanaerobaculia bacterium]|jgi:hypothetical protein|nr:hypothetical protein [Thermoanaerobaculia bacterium]